VWSALPRIICVESSYTFYVKLITPSALLIHSHCKSFLGSIMDKNVLDQKISHLLIESVKDYGIFMMDTKGIVVSWHRGAERVKGWKEHEVIGKYFGIFHTQKDQQNGLPERELQIALSEGKFEDEGLRVKSDGSTFWARVSLRPIFDNKGSHIGFAKVVQDIGPRREAELQNTRREAYLRAVFNQQFQFMAILSPEGTVLDINDLPLRAANISREQVVGRLFWETPWWDGLPDMKSSWPARLAAAAQATGPVFSEDRYRALDEVRVADASITAVKESDRRVQFFIVQATDITERKRVEEALLQSQKRLEKAISIETIGVLFFSLDGGISDANAAFQRMIGYNLEELRSLKWEVLTPAEFNEVTRQAANDLATYGETSPYEKQLIRKDGSRFWGLFAPTRLSGNGHNSECAEFIVNIEDRKRAEEEKLRLLRAAEEANRLKDDFLATASHELRTPLTSILGWSAMLRTQKFDGAMQLKGLETIERNARSQLKLIEDLLDVSRIITGKLRLDVQPCDPRLVTDAAIDSIQLAAESKGIRLEKVMENGVGLVSGDPARLQQVLWNLLSNSVKFTPKGGLIQVRLRRADSQVEISVKDTGIGISPDFLPFVFDRFRQQETGTTRAFGGLGLGLSIVRQIVEMHGGTVQVFSEGHGQGTTFVVKLPLLITENTQQFASTGRTISSECPEDLTGIRVLIVEDDADSRELLRVILDKCNASVIVTASGVEAMQVLERETPHVLISDIGLAVEDGYEFIRRVRELPQERGGRIPAIALTTFSRIDDRLKAIRAGYQHHITKPAEVAEIVALVSSLANLQKDPSSS
jgi:PAS domain S-box-containing protein